MGVIPGVTDITGACVIFAHLKHFCEERTFEMCINCNLLTPLLDSEADVLGVPRRTYLVFESTLVRKGISAPPTAQNRNQIYNYRTLPFIAQPAEGSYTKETVDGIDLYKGKLRILGPLPAELKPDASADLYLELFEGDLVWAENPDVPENPAPSALAGMANIWKKSSPS
jgi:hypothetical protein